MHACKDVVVSMYGVCVLFPFSFLTCVPPSIYFCHACLRARSSHFFFIGVRSCGDDGAASVVGLVPALVFSSPWNEGEAEGVGAEVDIDLAVLYFPCMYVSSFPNCGGVLHLSVFLFSIVSLCFVCLRVERRQALQPFPA